MTPIPIADFEDARLAPYRQLKQTNLTRWSGRFIAEGKLVVERLLASRFQTESLLLSERRLVLLEELPIPPGTTVYVVSEDQARELTGFNFHAGVMACGVRGEPDSLATVLPKIAADRSLWVACPRMTDPDNLGSLIRLCRAFGVTGLLLGEACCDPFSRRTLRVSMGNAFDLPIVESTDLRRDLERLRRDFGYQLSATVLDPSATPLHASMAVSRDVLLLGNETHGLSADWVALCDRQLTIPMSGGTDSLNVTVAAGIFLHWLQQADVPN